MAGVEAAASVQHCEQAAEAAAAASTSGRVELDREAFNQLLKVPALRIPNKRCSELMKAFRGFTLDRPRLRCIVPDGERQATKLLLLEEGVTLEGLTPELRDMVTSAPLELTHHEIQLDYKMFTADQVLKKLLPVGVDAPSSFETVGHIAHLNLREEQLPYRQLIGAVMLDKNPHLRTIVNKVGSIENEYRVFKMEVIAGQPSLETEVTQHGARFKLDFSQVYWNSRLESEHLRLVSSFQPGQVVVDMMAGIGPFAVPAAQRGCTVYANDLNPSSVRYMAVNVALNRVGQRAHVFNMDGRQFLRLLCATPGGPADQLPLPSAAAAVAPSQQPPSQAGDTQEAAPSAAAVALAAAAPPPTTTTTSNNSSPPAPPADPTAPKPAKRQKTTSATQEAAAAAAAGPPPATPPGFRPPEGGLLFDHVVMNLPATAIEFLDAFGGAFDPRAWRGRPLPMVHCYTFKRAAESEEDIVKRAEGYLGGAIDAGRDALAVHTVRDVAPNKLMLCLSFRLPQEVAFRGRAQEE